MAPVIGTVRRTDCWPWLAWPLAGLLLFVALACWPTSRALGPDYIQFWSASRILSAGGNPYDPQLQARENAAQGWRIDVQGVGRYAFLPYYYPPWLALALMPLVPLGYGLAKCAWLALLIVAVFGSSFLLRRSIPELSPILTMLVIAGFGVWWTAVPIGQTAPLVLLLIAAIWRLAAARRDLIAGVVLAWLSIKPQLALLLIIGTLVWAARQRRPLLIAGFAGCLAVLLGVSTCVEPGWLAAMLDAPRVTPLVIAEHPWMGATWFCLVRSVGVSGNLLYTMYAMAAVPAVAAMIWLASRRSTSLLSVLGGACWAAPLVVPYARYYDLAIMLVPLVALMGRPIPDRARGLLLAAFLLIPALAWLAYPGDVPPLVSQLEWLWMPAALATAAATQAFARQSRSSLAETVPARIREAAAL